MMNLLSGGCHLFQFHISQMKKYWRSDYVLTDTCPSPSVLLYSKADSDQLTSSQQKPCMCSYLDFKKVFYYSALAFSSVSHFQTVNNTIKAFLIDLIYFNDHSYRGE